MSVLDAKGNDLDHVALMRMVIDWLHRACAHKMTPELKKTIAEAELALTKEDAVMILHSLLRNAANREVIATYLHTTRGRHMPMRTLRKELKEMARFVAPLAKAAESGIVLP